jgi:hypothetical protein
VGKVVFDFSRIQCGKNGVVFSNRPMRRGFTLGWKSFSLGQRICGRTEQENTMQTDTNKESEMTSEELAKATGGVKNTDSPVVQTVMGAFEDTLKAAKAATAELARSQGGSLGSTHQL